MKIQFKENEQSLLINSLLIKLPGPIWEVFEYKNLVIVTLPPSWDLQNVFCYNQDGEQIWRIEKPGFFTSGTQGYDFVYLSDSGALKGRLLATNRGRPFELDAKTGKVTTIPGRFEK